MITPLITEFHAGLPKGHIVFGLEIFLSGTVHATLIDRGMGEILSGGSGSYKMIYDDCLDITWLDFTWLDFTHLRTPGQGLIWTGILRITGF
jgi:hypothetical protein